MDWNCNLKLLKYDKKTNKVNTIKVDLLEIRYQQIKEEYESNKIENKVKELMKKHSKE